MKLLIKRLFISLGAFWAFGCAPGVLEMSFDEAPCTDLPHAPLFASSPGPASFGGLPEDQGMDFAQHPETKKWYLAFRDGQNGNRVSVRFFSNGAWINVGTQAFPSGESRYLSLVFANLGRGVVPVIGFVSHTTVPVDKGAQVWAYESSTNSWGRLGGVLISGSSANFVELVTRESDGKLFVAASNGGFNGKLWPWSGTAWEDPIDIESSGSRAVVQTSLVSKGSAIYAAHKGPNSFKIVIKKITWPSGSPEVQTISIPDATGFEKLPHLAFHQGFLHLVYLERDSTRKPIVSRLDASETEWNHRTLGAGDARKWNYPKLFTLSGQLYVSGVDVTDNVALNRGPVAMRRVSENVLEAVPSLVLSTDQVFEQVPGVQGACYGNPTQLMFATIHSTAGNKIGLDSP